MTYGGVGEDVAYSIQQTSDGGYIVAGYTDTFGASDFDAWIIKLDAKGNVQWHKIYGGEDNDVGLLHPTDLRRWIHCGRLDLFLWRRR